MVNQERILKRKKITIRNKPYRNKKQNQMKKYVLKEIKNLYTYYKLSTKF